MPHVRTTLRALAASLLTGLATTGGRVYQSRVAPRSPADLPCLLVQTDGERISGDTSGCTQDRLLELGITGYALATSSLDGVLDQIALEVETALAADARFSLRQIDVDFDESLEKPAGMIRLTYEIYYFTPAGSPGVSA